MESKFVLPKVEQVAVVVDDLEATAAYLSASLGIEPFRISERSGPVTVNGRPTRAQRKLGIARMGGIDLELIQPLETGTPYDDFIKSRGPGLQHIRFAPVADLKQTVAYLEAKGFKLAYGGEHAGSHFAYMESEKAKGFVLEFVQRAKA
ncbi:MAG: methylmalonyl-CoA/ethylmalonyl-CoA epimerase [Dehalococcoidales bacterium]|nr:methylmalonyl-CoA/ethylmalonyl-CoA epimerase [Dehalococcoidales bacterium]